MRAWLVLFCATLLFSSCEKESDTAAAPAISQATFDAQIKGRGWLEAWEEEQPGSDIKVYRPDTAPLPASWPRKGFRFDPDGVFTGRGPSPLDGVAVYPGRWMTEDYHLFRITPSGQSTSYGIQLISLQNDVLKVREVQ